MLVFKKEESDMFFGDYPKEDVYHIEESQAYGRLNSHGVKTVEFVLLRGCKLIFIEAKKTTPDFKSIDRIESYNAYIADISQKFSDSIDLFMSTYIGRQNDDCFPEKMKFSDIPNSEIQLIVVVKNAHEDSLRHYNDKFRVVLNHKMRIWSNCQLFVISEAQARKKGLVKSITGRNKK